MASHPDGIAPAFEGDIEGLCSARFRSRTLTPDQVQVHYTGELRQRGWAVRSDAGGSEMGGSWIYADRDDLRLTVESYTETSGDLLFVILTIDER